jgi:hypothetical protein
VAVEAGKRTLFVRVKGDHIDRPNRLVKGRGVVNHKSTSGEIYSQHIS